MPTEKQLDIIWESQLEFFGGFGLPKANYLNEMDDNGLVTMKTIDTPLVSKNSFLDFKGPKVGEITIDVETREIKLIVDSSNEEPLT